MAKNKKNKKIKNTTNTIDEIDSDIETQKRLNISIPLWIKSEVSFIILFFILGFITYLFSLGNEFVWDDVEVIKKSYFRFENSNFKSIFIPVERAAKALLYYRPIIATSFIVDWNNWNLNPFGYHLSNSIFYSLAVASMFFLSNRIANVFNIKRVYLFSVLSTLLFMLHPMHVESVSWIAGRTDVLCGLFFILALGFHIFSYRNIHYLLITS